MTGYTILEFRAVPCHHFFFCAAMSGCFAAAYVHTQNTEFEGVQFYIFGAAGGGVHFLLMLLSHCFNETAKVKEKYKHAPGCIGLYRFFLFCSLPYNIAGAVMTGTRGICSDMEDCVYQENYAVNLAMAISITALHGFSFFHALMISSKSSQTENEAKALAAPKPAPKKTEAAAANPKPAPAPASQKTLAQGTEQAPKPTPQPKPAPKPTAPAPTQRPMSAPIKKTKSPNKTRTSETPKKIREPSVARAGVLKTISADVHGANGDNVPLGSQFDEEMALHWLRMQQIEEMRRQREQAGFHDDGRPYTPLYPPPPMPAPPSYEVAISGGYPSHDPLQPRALTPDINDPCTQPWLPGLELETSREYNSEISRQYMRSTSGMPPEPESLLVHPHSISHC